MGCTGWRFKGLCQHSGQSIRATGVGAVARETGQNHNLSDGLIE